MMIRRPVSATKEEAQRYRDQFVVNGVIDFETVKTYTTKLADKLFVKPNASSKTKAEMSEGFFKDIINKIENY